MLKVLLVDDELLIRTNIKCMVDWEAFGMTICAEASNGAEALKLVKKLAPDIILTDMRMPVMDGLELSQQLKALGTDSLLIVLSNYNDFEYVKGTLKNGAIDYILKHNLNKDSLGEVLLRAREKAAGRDVIPAARSYSMNNVLALKEKFIISLLSGFYTTEEDIREQLLFLDIPLHTKNVLTAVMVVDDYGRTIPKGALQDASLFELTVINIIEEILGDMGNGAVCHIENGKYALLFSYDNLHSRAKINEAQNYALNRIQTCIKKFLNASVSFGMGPICGSIMKAGESFGQAEKILENRFVYGKGCILYAEDRRNFKSGITCLEIETERRLRASLRAGEDSDMLSTLESIFNEIRESKLSTSSSQIIFSDLLNLAGRVCREADLPAASVFLDNEAPYVMLSNLDTVDDVEIWFTEIFTRLRCLIINGQGADKYSPAIRSAISYMTRNFAGEITLSGVAEAVNVSSAYLSKLFKKETGTGFSEFLCDLRLEKAKLLLEDGKKDTKEITKLCGFNNYTYFFNVFKQKTGLTPKEYIASGRHYL